MREFPEFTKNAANRIAAGSQATPGVEGYVFDGADRSQMAFWTCRRSAGSAAHVHDFDQYMLVVEGCYTLVIDGRRIPVGTGEEYFIPRGTPHSGEVVAGTRTIHAFGGTRASRAAAAVPPARSVKGVLSTYMPKLFSESLRLQRITKEVAYV